jgi:L-methionine (R)-S-oxide reductase
MNRPHLDSLLNQIKSVASSDQYWLSNLSNTVAMLHSALGNWWTGFYLIHPQNKELLVLGPFQGPVACTEIPSGKGVCGTVFASGESLVVDNVHEFDGHIACSAESNSEVVIPLRNKDNNVIGVLDLDSTKFSNYTDEHKVFLEAVCEHLKEVNDYGI